MIPSVDERLASIIRALSEVILPHLPPEASLAQEQAHLAIGHLQILRLQLDAAPAFEREELADAQAIGKALAAAITGGAATTIAIAALAASTAGADGADVLLRMLLVQSRGKQRMARQKYTGIRL